MHGSAWFKESITWSPWWTNKGKLCVWHNYARRYVGQFLLAQLLKYAHAYAYKCLIYQKCVCWGKKLATPLQPIVVQETFQKWGLCDSWDISKLIKVASLHSHCHRVLNAMEKINSAQRGEWWGSPQFPQEEYHLHVRHSDFTCFWKCNIFVIVKIIWICIGKCFCIKIFN